MVLISGKYRNTQLTLYGPDPYILTMETVKEGVPFCSHAAFEDRDVAIGAWERTFEQLKGHHEEKQYDE